MNHLRSVVETNSGETIRVDLRGNAANVLILDDLNYSLYQRRQQFRYFGGFFNRSPALLVPPHGGRWNVVVDLGGRGGRVEASVSVVA